MNIGRQAAIDTVDGIRTLDSHANMSVKAAIILSLARRYCRYGVGYCDVALASGRADETDVKVRGQWAHPCPAVDKFGNTIDFYLSPTSNAEQTKRLPDIALFRLSASEWITDV